MTNEEALAELAALRAGVSDFHAALAASYKARVEVLNDAAVASYALGILREEYMGLIMVIQAVADASRVGGADGLAGDIEAEARASLNRVGAALYPDRDTLN